MNDTLTIGATSTDAQLIEYMKESRTVEEWNEKREIVKTVRDNKWIAAKLDGSRLITKTNIPNRTIINN